MSSVPTGTTGAVDPYIRGSAIITRSEARERGWVELPSESGDGGGGPAFARPLSGFLTVVKGPDLPEGFDGRLADVFQHRGPSASPDDPMDIRPTNAGTVEREVAADMPRVEAMLGQLLGAHGIDTGTAVDLSLDADGRLRVGVGHPRAETIQALLDERPGLSGDLTRMIRQNDTLARNRLLGTAYDEGLADDGVIQRHEWEDALEEARSLAPARGHLTFADGRLTSPAMQAADALLGLG